MTAHSRQPASARPEQLQVFTPPIDLRLMQSGALKPHEVVQLQHEIAKYIATMTAEMAGMARMAKLDILTYFLDMARLEAEASAERNRY
jgi:hypothetical protein